MATQESISIFAWKEGHWKRWVRVVFFLLLSLGAHVFFFYLFRVSYLQGKGALPQPKQVTFLTSRDPELRPWLRRLEHHQMWVLPESNFAEAVEEQVEPFRPRFRPSFEEHEFSAESLQGLASLASLTGKEGQEGGADALGSLANLLKLEKAQRAEASMAESGQLERGQQQVQARDGLTSLKQGAAWAAWTEVEAGAWKVRLGEEEALALPEWCVSLTSPRSAKALVGALKTLREQGDLERAVFLVGSNARGQVLEARVVEVQAEPNAMASVEEAAAQVAALLAGAQVRKEDGGALGGGKAGAKIGAEVRAKLGAGGDPGGELVAGDASMLEWAMLRFSYVAQEKEELEEGS